MWVYFWIKTNSVVLKLLFTVSVKSDLNDVLIDDNLLENLLDLPPEAFELIEDKINNTKYIRVKSGFINRIKSGKLNRFLFVNYISSCYEIYILFKQQRRRLH